MTRVNIDYSKTIIYKIVCKDLTIKDLYVGHTTDFTRRKAQHKYYCNTEHSLGFNMKLYEMVRNNGGWDNWEMVLVENYSCSNGNEARTKERYWYETLHANMNTQKPNRTHEEYRLDNRDVILEKKKIDYQNNKEHYKEMNEKWKSEHTEEIKEMKVKWYNGNLSKIKERNKIICKCECGKEYTLCNKARHLKTKYHEENINV